MKYAQLRKRVRDHSQPPVVIRPITLSDPAIVEIAGFAGAEAIMIDCEHGMMGVETVRSMLVHAEAAGIPAVFRPRSFDAAACRQALDQGAAGIHVPHVDTAEQVRVVVRACRYPDLGQREMSLGRAIDYNLVNFQRYISTANESQLLVVMIESVESLENVDEIAAVPGIDVLHMGIADLTCSMGLAYGQPHREVQEAVERVLKAAKRHSVEVGYPTETPDEVAHWLSRGVRYFEADTPDYLLRGVIAERVAALKEVFANATKNVDSKTPVLEKQS